MVIAIDSRPARAAASTPFNPLAIAAERCKGCGLCVAICGTAFCSVIIADRAIGSPIVDLADSVIALNPPSMARFEPMLIAGGLLVLNSSLIEAEPRRTDIEIAALPCTALARTAGHDQLVSIVALGALVARRPIVAASSVRAALTDLIGTKHPEFLEADLAAFEAGYAAAGTADVAASATSAG